MVVPHLLEAGDVVELQVSAHLGTEFRRARRCKILTISEPNRDFYRDSMIEWLDTEERCPKLWKAAKGINQPVVVVDGPKLRAALRHEANVHYSQYTLQWIWDGYEEETVGV